MQNQAIIATTRGLAAAWISKQEFSVDSKAGIFILDGW